MTRFTSSQRKNQRGQALVFSLITVGIILLTMVTMYSMGQQSINKSKLQNTADAAAYSAVIAEARDYNFAAYTNRAMIANQVAVAQMVGLTSWARNLDGTYNGPLSWLPKVLTSLGGPLAKILWDTPVNNVYSKASSKIKSAMDTVAPKAIKALDILIDVLNVAQKVYHYGTALTVAQTIGLSPAKVLDKLAGVDESSLGAAKDILTFNDAYNVIKLNDPQADLSTPGTAAAILHLAQWFLFVQSKDPNQATNDGPKGDRMAQATVDSLDGFSKERSTKGGGPAKNFPEMMYLTPFVVDPTRFIPYQNGAVLMYLWHRGGTELKVVSSTGAKKTWSAMDATGFTGVGILWISILGIPIPIPIPLILMPMGWGAAQAGTSSDLGTNNNFGKTGSGAAGSYGGVYTSANTAASAGIQRGKGAGATLEKGAGLRTYFDVKNVTKDNLLAPPLILEIEKADSSIPSSNAVSGGQFALNNGTQSGYMRSLTKAQVYFSRPKKLWARADGKTELGSLYNPYWQATLAPNSFLEQYASMSYHLW
jgi:Flp pilus assembly protein TadG